MNKMKSIYYVDFLSTTENGQAPAGRAEMQVDGGVRFKGVNKLFIDEWEQDGINVGDGKILYPKDGIEFLRSLHIACSGSYFRASKARKLDKHKGNNQ